MLSYYSLCRNEKAFKQFTGITVAEFERLYADFEPVWVAAEQKRLQRPERKRAIGGGNNYKLGPKTQLLMVMVWLRLYLTTAAVGYLFGISQSAVSRNTRRLLAVLREVSGEEFGWPDPPRKGEGRGMQEAAQAYPDLFAIVDATEQPVERPQDREQEKLHYSGKRHYPTCKTSLIVNEHGVIRAITDTSPGRTHDLTQIRQSGVLDDIPIHVGVVGDAGYIGLHNDLPNHSVATAHKAQRNHPLEQAHKDINRELSSMRVIIENVICQLKHFRILSDRFRHDVTKVHSDVFALIATLVNRRIKRRLALSNVC
ncbi:hypothetical protein LCGC14_2581830 [marine sediment metagenome]|uniref:DDE Tnp4 domain-containing protein n=1 Tax=marine sediment metagenome TaxID=412755 RepID=A0A0F9AEL8_9ZZZZ